MRVLVLAAHPDDEVLGAGGTILRHRLDGDEIVLVVATQAHPPRWSESAIRQKREECLRAARILGISDVRFLGLPTMHLAALPAIELNSAVERVFLEIEPHVLYAPPMDDINTDHAALFSAALVSARPVGRSPLQRLYSYEIPTTTRFNVGSRWQPNCYVDISGQVETKLEAMSAYQTELRDAPHPRSLEGIRTLAAERGLAIGTAFAEAHMLVREIR